MAERPGGSARTKWGRALGYTTRAQERLHEARTAGFESRRAMDRYNRYVAKYTEIDPKTGKDRGPRARELLKEANTARSAYLRSGGEDGEALQLMQRRYLNLIRWLKDANHDKPPPPKQNSPGFETMQYTEEDLFG